MFSVDGDRWSYMIWRPWSSRPLGATGCPWKVGRRLPGWKGKGYEGIQRRCVATVKHLATEALSRFQHVIAAGSANDLSICQQLFSMMSACQSLPLSFGQHLKSSTTALHFPKKRQGFSESSRFPNFLGQKTVGFCEELRDFHRFSACSPWPWKAAVDFLPKRCLLVVADQVLLIDDWDTDGFCLRVKTLLGTVAQTWFQIEKNSTEILTFWPYEVHLTPAVVSIFDIPWFDVCFDGSGDDGPLATVLLWAGRAGISRFGECGRIRTSGRAFFTSGQAWVEALKPIETYEFVSKWNIRYTPKWHFSKGKGWSTIGSWCS